VGNSEGKRPLRRFRRRWGIIFKWIFKKWGEGIDYIAVAQDRDSWWVPLNAVINVRVP
jgi:hypothetical protein